MQVIYKIPELALYIERLKKQNLEIGFVPTMGALHEGHLSLIGSSKKRCPVTLTSIFVNPTQFNDPNDLKNYPRDLETDLKKLASAGCDAVFVPSESDMYPEKDTRVFDFDGIDTLMEGEHRPGHFNGVAQIVSKLFDLVNPDVAFFGQKDFQQVAIIRKMVKKLNLNVQIVACPIIRETDGLAMSSRNLLLTEEHRKIAPLIHQTLMQAVAKSNGLSVPQIKSWVVETINQSGLLKVEYFEVVDDQQLIPSKTFKNGKNNIGCIAVWAGNIRLIDNISFNL